MYSPPSSHTGMPMAVKLNSSREPKPSWRLTSLASRLVEVPSREMVPPSTVANDRGSSTLEGETPRRWHQPSITGSRVATIGVLGMKPEMRGHHPHHQGDHAPGAADRLGSDQGPEPIQATAAEQPGGNGEQAHQGDQGRAAEALHRLIGLEHPEADQQGGRQQAGDLRGEPAGDEQHHRPDEHRQRDQSVRCGGDREERLHRHVQR